MGHRLLVPNATSFYFFPLVRALTQSSLRNKCCCDLHRTHRRHVSGGKKKRKKKLKLNCPHRKKTQQQHLFRPRQRVEVKKKKRKSSVRSHAPPTLSAPVLVLQELYFACSRVVLGSISVPSNEVIVVSRCSSVDPLRRVHFVVQRISRDRQQDLLFRRTANTWTARDGTQ